LNRIFTCFIVVASVLASNQVVRAQDYYNFAQFYINPSLINPSFVGIDGQPAAFLAYKKQWMGISGAPSIGNFSIQAPLPSKLGVGLNVGNDSRGVLSSTSLLLSGSYYIPLAKDQFFRFGISFGAAWSKVDVEELSWGSTSDKVMADLLSSNFQLLGNAGISYHSKTFQIGASIPNIFQPAYLSQDAFTITEVKPFESMIFHTSYRFYFSHDMHSFEPYLLYRLNGSTPSQFEAAGVLHLKNLVWVGASYKQNFGISGLLGYKFNKLIGLGYSYTIKNSGYNQLAKPSHEIQLALLFGAHNKKTPLYSFINSEKEKGRKTPTHVRQDYYARNNPKNTNSKKPLKPATQTSKPATTQTQPGRPRNSTTSDPIVDSPTKTNPTQTNPTQTNPAQTNPAQTNPAQTNPAQTNPAQTNPAQTNPAQANPAQTNPAQTNPAQTNPAQTNPAQTNPAQTNPAQTNPAQTNPAQTNPAQTNPAQTNPARTNPAQTNPAQTNPTQTNPAQTEPIKPNAGEEIIKRPDRFSSEADSVQHHEEVDKINRLTEHAENPTEEHNEDGHPHAERHEFARRGDHAKELELGDYVIVGVFRSEPNAKHMTDELRKLGFSEADYGYLTDKAVWYIHFKPTDDIEEAKAKRNKYRKMKMFKDAWLLTVHQ
jgi:type IX secretion system PorP/SprF family membrane protein